MKGNQFEIESPNILEPDRPQHNSSTVFVIAQQYSFTTFFSLRFHSLRKQFGTLFKVFVGLFYCFKIACPNLRHLKNCLSRGVTVLHLTTSRELHPACRYYITEADEESP
jgi:hypothetical protein